MAQRDVSFGKRWIELNGFERGRFRLGYRLNPERTQKEVRIGEACMRQRVFGIFGYGLLQVLDRLLETGNGALVPVKPSPQVKLIGFGVVGVPPGGSLPFLPGESETELFENLARDIVLDRQNIGDRPVVLTTPELGPVGDIHEIGLNDEQVSACDDSPRDDRADIEVAPRFQWIDVLSFVSECQAARAD